MTTLMGRCHCGAVAFEVRGEPIGRALCHCADCRRSAGAPMVGWAMFPAEAFKVARGAARTYASSEHGRRHFCAACGTGLYYTNDKMLPGIVDVQIATLDDPNALAPQCHIQVAERLDWMRRAHDLPEFERYPPQA